MAIPDKDLRILLQKSGNRCAFTECRELMTAPSTPQDGAVVLGHVAHIVGQSRRGPRGKTKLDGAARDAYANLILLCTRHHKLVDSQPQTYTAMALTAMKGRHEEWVEATLGRGTSKAAATKALVTDTLHSNLMPVERLPRFVYSAPCSRSDGEIAEEANWPGPPLMAPWALRSGRLYAFQDLAAADSPFARVVQRSDTQRHRLADWFDDPDATNRFLAMGNRSLISLARRRGLFYDRDHKRFYFPPTEAGKERTASYRSVKGRRIKKRVVYQPKSKKYGTPLSFWIHWALRLRLIQIAADEFVVSFTPDLRITSDGEKNLPPELVGEKVTRRKTHWYNFQTLSHVHFWRDYLSQGKPRIVLPFANSSSMVISTTLIQASVTWPGIPPEFAKAFTNVDYPDNLFTLLEQRLYGQDDDAETGDNDETDDE